MDKICRGSAIGEAHRSGAWRDDVGSQLDTSRTARGNSVSTHSLKLENTSPRGKPPANSRGAFVSDTFRSQEWFRHDGHSEEKVPQLSPRFWKGANALSPAPGAMQSGRSKSTKDLKAGEENVNIEQRGHYSPRAPRSPRGGVSRARSEGTFIKPSEAFAQKTPSVADGYTETTYSRAQSPRDALFGDTEQTNGESNARQRSPSPTFATSEQWMGYNSGFGTGNKFDVEKDAPSMPSRNFQSKARRQHSGRVSEETWKPARGDLAGEPSPPPIIINAVSGAVTKGKKTNIVKDSDNAKRRLRLDQSQTDITRSEKKHSFPTDPQGQRQLEEMSYLSPRLFSPGPQQSPPPNGGSQGSRAPAQDPRVVDVQHRTSAEMASSMMPDTARAKRQLEPVAQAQFESDDRKYLVGQELVNWTHHGRRGASDCFSHICQVAAEATADAGGQMLGHPPTSLRDHRNSDVLREHLQAPAAVSRVRQERQQPVVVPLSVYSYGDISSLPSTMPKDTAYLHSGLKVVKFGPRTPGYFSPYAGRVPVSLSQAMG
mmetsp:Transcript_15306/g.27285  ORF Transcript_15306/g.27285 Transcript_15306/m.27285 type:complete len:543 (-) Transcript_15306:169-1797(-)